MFNRNKIDNNNNKMNYNISSNHYNSYNINNNNISILSLKHPLNPINILTSKIFLFIYSLILTFFILYDYNTYGSLSNELSTNKSNHKCPYKFAGGSPSHEGSCWCGWDGYCLCSPSLAIDAIIEIYPDDLIDYNENENYNNIINNNIDKNKPIGIILVERKDGLGNAIVGGFVEIGETVENTVYRETLEETGLIIEKLEQFHVYSEPKRDPRRHNVSVVFICRAKGTLKAGDDAKEAKFYSFDQIKDLNFAFDHKTILHDYLLKYHPEELDF